MKCGVWPMTRYHKLSKVIIVHNDNNNNNFTGMWQGREFTERLLEETHKKWKELLSREKRGKIMTENTSHKGSPWRIR